MKKRIAENLNRIENEIAEACQRRRRNPADVRLIAVTKTVGLETIRMLLELGQADLGESRVQELTQRSAMIKESLSRRLELAENDTTEAETDTVMPRWHMVGHLQRNKVRYILSCVELIHSVDSLRLAEEINTAAAKLGLAHKVRVLLQVNASKEKQKSGVAVGAAAALAEQVETLPNMQIIGLMTMAPLTNDQNVQRFCFARLREIFEEMRGENVVGPQFRHLSMGMSQDYVPAVEEGATLIRIGTALFE